MLPLVTIGVCVKNCESSITDVVRTIVDQDFPHKLIEVIFVDDGSTDRTLPTLLHSITRMDTQVKVFHDKWRGLGWARNVVVNNATGEYIIWVDGDMILPHDHVTKQVEFMEQNPKIGAAKARYEISLGENFVATLENAAYMAVDIRYGGKTTSRTLGTGGSIYRVKAVRQVGGFDSQITGTGEDMDAEYRIREAGWLLHIGTPAHFYERRRETWKELWKEAFWHGYGVHYVLGKNHRIFSFYKMTPLAGFLAGAWYSTLSYKVIRRKVVFLLPIQYAFKRIAWCYGFARGKIENKKAGAPGRKADAKEMPPLPGGDVM